MRIETKARRDNSIRSIVAQSSFGVTTAALLVWLYGNRQSAGNFLDQVRMPISLLNFEPFSSAMRPNGLRVNKQQMRQRKCETKRHPKALNNEDGRQFASV